MIHTACPAFHEELTHTEAFLSPRALAYVYTTSMESEFSNHPGQHETCEEQPKSKDDLNNTVI